MDRSEIEVFNFSGIWWQNSKEMSTCTWKLTKILNTFFFISLITYVWISVTLINLAVHWKTNTVTATKTWLTNHRWWYFEKKKLKRPRQIKWQHFNLGSATKGLGWKSHSESETKIKLSHPDWSSCKFS